MTSDEDDDAEFLPTWSKSAGSLRMQDWLAFNVGGDHPIAQDSSVGFGFVHRLDSQTSGPLLWARSYKGYYTARLQFAAHRVHKEYVCLCHGYLTCTQRLLQAPLLTIVEESGTGAPRSVVSSHGRRAKTEILSAWHFNDENDNSFSLVHIRLHTGRMHQIRVHLATEGSPILGDMTYGKRKSAPTWCPRLCLHSAGVHIDVGDGPLHAEVPLPMDIGQVLRAMKPVDHRSHDAQDRWAA